MHTRYPLAGAHPVQSECDPQRLAGVVRKDGGEATGLSPVEMSVALMVQ